MAQQTEEIKTHKSEEESEKSRIKRTRNYLANFSTKTKQKQQISLVSSFQTVLICILFSREIKRNYKFVCPSWRHVYLDIYILNMYTKQYNTRAKLRNFYI